MADQSNHAANLHLVRDDRGPEDPIPFDRRESPRARQLREGLALLDRTDDDVSSISIAPVQLQDVSDSGVGLISRVEPKLGQGARLMVPGTPLNGADARVVRIEPMSDGTWSVGMRIRRRLAA